jgi:hypothetical protein
MKVDVDVDVDVDKKQNESSQILLCWKNLGWLFFSMYQPAFSLSFVFLLASKGRQNRQPSLKLRQTRPGWRSFA